MRKSAFVSLGLLTLVLAAALGAFLWHGVQATSVLAVEAQIQALQPVMSAARFALIATIALAWPGAIRLLQARGYLDAQGAAFWHAHRLRAVLWLVVIELMLGQDLVARFLESLGQAGPWM